MDIADLESAVNQTKREIKELKAEVEKLKSVVHHLKGDINIIIEGGTPAYYE